MEAEAGEKWSFSFFDFLFDFLFCDVLLCHGLDWCLGWAGSEALQQKSFFTLGIEKLRWLHLVFTETSLLKTRCANECMRRTDSVE